ncbi:MAG TPA: hypothetical protein VFK13_03415 [Gemmatimonadaceae bacterium]|nr:hypothetical protein [Gemmatimonadaceae bacterium]
MLTSRIRAVARANTVLILLAVAAVTIVPAAQAQIGFGPKQKPASTFLEIGFLMATPEGEFADHIGNGYGGAGYLLHTFDRNRVIGLRLDFGLVTYGHERQRTCISATIGCRIEVNVNTNNNIMMAAIGPQLMAPTGTFRPYVNASVGLAYLFTQSSLDGVGGAPESIAQTTNFDDATFAWNAGGGLYIPLRNGPRPISLDIGAQYHANGRAQYLREGSITDNPDGSISFTPIDSQTRLLSYHLGVTFGF